MTATNQRRVVRTCPYRNCGWEFDEPPLQPTTALTIEDNVRVHVAKVEQACADHLNRDHPGWTFAEVEAESLQAQVSAVFNVSIFGPKPRRKR